jgi:lipopolysaccharide/colanic/teichoic acid biosynthesis glycosyltransferase
MERDWSAPSAPISGQDTVHRIGDVLIALGLILLTGPLMALVCMAIRLESVGPLLYGLPRLGPGGKPFRLLKFRTVREPGRDAVWHRGECETRVGRFLRYTRIEELPQLFNLLRGDIALLGY